jgi:3-methyladenine DNA glycosylase/8-oxoguanine DNA glycosylase
VTTLSDDAERTGTRRLRPDHPVDLRRTLRPLGHGALDPTLRVGDGHGSLALRTPAGPATLHLTAEQGPGEIVATAWGSDASVGWALDHAPAIAGCDDAAAGFVPIDRRVAELWRRNPGIRMGRTGLVTAALLAVVPGQRVSTDDAARSFRAVVRRWGAPAPGPGPVADGLWVQPDPAVLAALPYTELHPLGIERRRAETLRRIAGASARLDALADPGMPAAEARRRMALLPGVGPWTVGSAAAVALGDPDAVAVGDLHLKHTMCWLLAGEPRGTDERMLELLAPYAGHRGRVCRLAIVAGAAPRRRGPGRGAPDISRL